MKLNNIYNEDCIEGMEKLFVENGGEWVDCVVTDPPFNISQKNNFHTMKGRKGIDFGKWDWKFDLTKWIDSADKLLKTGGSMLIFNAWRNMGKITNHLENKGYLIKEMLIWKKTNPMPRNRDRLYVTSCEYAIWATKGKGWTYNRQRDTYENGIFEYPIVHHSRRIHPTQKPIELMEDLLKIHTNKDDVVLDPFSGSASTLEACINLDRNYIGFELDKEYYDLANKRLQQHKNNIITQK